MANDAVNEFHHASGDGAKVGAVYRFARRESQHADLTFGKLESWRQIIKLRERPCFSKLGLRVWF